MSRASALDQLLLLGGILLIGNAAVALLKAPRVYALPLGVACVAVVVSVVMVSLDGSVESARIALAVLAALSLVRWRDFWTNRRAIVITSVVTLAVWLVILAAPIAGGSQFSSFRGNWWDHFNYLAGMEVVAYHRVSAIRTISDALAGSDPIALYGYSAITLRPATVLVAAVFRVGAADVFSYSYAYLAMLLSIFGVCVAEVLAERRVVRGKVWYYLIGGATAIGFWGQLLLDTSVWSHILALPIIAALVFQILWAPRMGQSAESRVRSDAVSSGVLFLGAFVVYPEATLFVGVLLLATVLAATRSVKSTLLLAGAYGAAGLLATLTDYLGVTRFLFGQVALGVGKPTGSGAWFLYFFQPYFGYDFTDRFAGQIASLQALAQQGGPFALIRSVLAAQPATAALPLNTFPILLGYYPLVAALTNWSIILGVLVSVAITVAAVWYLFFPRAGETASDASRRLWIFLVGFAVLLAVLAARAKIWEVGKGFTYVLPIVTAILFVRLIEIDEPSRLRRRVGLALTLLFFACSGYFALSRVALAAQPQGIGHGSPFPSVLHLEDKTRFHYETPVRLGSCASVDIAEKQPNRSLYLLLSARQFAPAWFAEPFSYFGAGKTYAHAAGQTAQCHLHFGRAVAARAEAKQ